MKILDVIETDLRYVETLAETKLLPWLEHTLTQVEHDFVTAALPLAETAGAQVALEVVSGQPVEAIVTAVVALAEQFGKNLLKVGAQTTAQDFSATLTAYLASLAATGAKPTAAQPQG